jgi:hypothetical protein
MAARAGIVYFTGNLYNNGYFLCQAATLAYRPDGKPLWTNLFNAPASATDTATALAVDEDGTAYVVGSCYEAGTNSDWFTIAYGSSGTPLWTNWYSGPGNGMSAATAVAVRQGAVYVSGYSRGIGTEGDFTVISYTAAGVGRWTNRYDGPAHRNDDPYAMAADRSGTVFVVGDNYDSVVAVAYSSAGTPLWTNVLPTMAVQAATVDTSGNLIVAGWISYDAGPNSDYLVAGVSGSGVPLWTNHYDGPAHRTDDPIGKFSVTAGPAGAIYLTGESEGIRNGVTNYDWATVKYVPSPDILLSPQRQAGGVFRVSITAPSNTAYCLEASPDFTNWQTLTNFAPLPVESVDYTDTQAPGFARRYYRTVWNP